MLSEWLGGLSIVDFEALVRRKQAWARPGSASPASLLCSWETLDEILSAKPAPDVIVVARGAFLGEPPPRSHAQLRRLFQRGAGICVRRSEAHSSRLQRLGAALEQELPGRVHIQIFATPAGTHGFSWHYDEEDVFIVQTAGIKDYYFKANTQPRALPGKIPDFARFRVETSQLQTARLAAGDCLYIPRGWWHMAHCIEHSLSMSLGVTEVLDPAFGIGGNEPG